MSSLTFDLATHIYADDKGPLWAVSDILTLAGLRPDYGDRAEAARQRGKAVHKLCEQHDLDAVDMLSIPPDLLGYLLAWQKFRNETGFLPTRIEEPVASSFYRIAGTPDRVGTVGDKTWLIDIKSGQPTAADALQVAAYQYMLEATMGGQKIDTRTAVYLRKDGTYATPTKPFTDQNDIKIFLAALSTVQWRQAHGLLNGGGP